MRVARARRVGVGILVTVVGSGTVVAGTGWAGVAGAATSRGASAATSRPGAGVGALPTSASQLLAVDVRAGRHPISPGIYGVNWPDPGLAAALRLPVQRWGGNAVSRYNDVTNTSNTGSDWFFENITRTPAQSLASFVATGRKTRTASIVTVPMTGWVAKASPASHPYTCGFPSSAFPQQDQHDPWDAGCGNGVAGGVELAASPQTTSQPAGPDWVKAMVGRLVAANGTAAHGGVPYYELDNEPSLWSSTHRDVHPAKLTYNELAARSTATAAAVKAADPSAKVLGPSDWGWCAWFFSAADGCSAGADRAAHAGMDLTPWYLRQLKAYQTAHGVRLLDYLDQHYYPQGGTWTTGAGDAATQAKRLRSTRSLWDPTYVDESWIGKPVMLVPRMKAWVAAEYPGTKLSISEYSFGAIGTLNGALAQADALGIFGWQGVDLATLWGPPKPTDPGAFAFRMYRNYDGRGAAFGDVAVGLRSRSPGSLAVYAAQRTSDGALTVMVINKSGAAITTRTALAGFSPAGAAARYTYSGARLGAIVHGANVATTATGWSATYPASSITLLVIPKKR